MKAFPLLPILGLIFITLKLCGVIAWSWLWVLAPFWLGFVIFLVVALMWMAAVVGLKLYK